MDAWHFTEMPYPYHPDPDTVSSVRVNLPSKYFDPKIGHELYNRYLDEHMLADELGLEIMLNEHHQTATCLDVAAPLSAAILARQTTRARILILGNPIANQHNPIRVAEEMAMIDCISNGRLEVGFVRGVPYEIFAANSNPTMTIERLWEGMDMCIKAWTSHDGPVNFEGRFWHRRCINVWPRCIQQPHPPIWITGGSDLNNVRRVAERGYIFTMFLQPHERIRVLFDTYRERCKELGQPPPAPDRFAYMPLVYTADTEEEALAGAKELSWYLQAKTEPQFRNPPGYVPIDLNVQALKGKYQGRTDVVRRASIEYLREQGVVICGTPDHVAQQVKRLYDRVGGFGHLIMMQQAGYMSHEKTVKSMTMFAKEVYPQIRELGVTAPEMAAS